MAPTTPRRWWALGAISLAVLAVTLDLTVLTVALPTLAVELDASEAQLQWFVTAYTLALVAGMLPAGLIADRFGRRRLLLAAIVVFGLGSIGCAFAPNPQVFIAARVVLGLAGAAIIVVALASLTVLFDEDERPRAIGIWGAANFIGLPLGPILGGWILTNAWWGWIFLINVPVALVAFAAVASLVPESRSAHAPGIDLAGIALSSVGLVALMYGVVEAGEVGWSDPSTLAWLIGGLLILAVFVAWERRLGSRPDGEPLVDLTLFRTPSYTWGVVCTAFGVFGLFGAMFALPQYFQAVGGLDPQGSGLRLLPLVAGLVLGAVSADRIVARIGPKVTAAAGFGFAVVALVVGSNTSVSSGDAFLAAWTFLLGAGSGLAFATTASVALVEISPERSGIAAGLLQAVTKLGPAIGATVLGSALIAAYQAHLDVTGLPPAAAVVAKDSVFGAIAVAGQIGSTALVASAHEAFVAGMHDALLVAAGGAAIGAFLALAYLPVRSKVTSSRDAGGTQPHGATAA